MNLPAHIYLYGPSGAGKSTVARLLAESLELPVIDLDTEITRSAGKSIAEIFTTSGEQGFRKMESRLLHEAATRPESVIALGGGTLLDPANRKVAESSGEIVCLKAPYEVLLQRVEQGQESRPLLGEEHGSKLQAYLSSRQEHYQSFAHQLDTGALNPKQAVRQIQMLTGRHLMRGMQPYQIRISTGILENLSSCIDQRDLILITDETVAAVYRNWLADAQKDGQVRTVIRIPAGESSKSLHILNKIWDQLLTLSADRSSIILALGGGVIGDLAGFAAATFMRGINWINLPSTLLAQVDAAIGGKTGINLPQGKNLVGAFYPPRQVLIDPNLLLTLPREEFANGMAEVIKHAVIAGEPLLGYCRADFTQPDIDLTKLVRAAAAVKVNIVERDPYESQIRAILNFGHTIGHAIEKNSSYSLKHGQAVAVGMAVETYIAEKIGFAAPGMCAELCYLLQAHHLPIHIPPGQDTAAILETARYDKKSRDGQLTFALPSAFGAVHPGIQVDNLDRLIDAYRQKDQK